MKKTYISHIELIRGEELKVAKTFINQMLNQSNKERKVWIFGQSL